MICIFNIASSRNIVDVNRNTYIKPMFHPARRLKFHDIIYVVEGSFGVSIENETIYAKKDSVVIPPAEVTHYGISKFAQGTKTIFLHVSHENGDGYTNHITPKFQTNKKYLKTHIDVSDMPTVKKYFENIFMAFSNGETHCASAWFTILLCKPGENLNRRSKNDTLAYKIKSIIDQDLCTEISNRRLASEIDRSIKSAEHLFKKKKKKTFVITIHRYIISERLKKAKFYLENFPNISIASIAENLGFYDEFHLSRQFKKEYNISPSKFRSETSKTEFISCK